MDRLGMPLRDLSYTDTLACAGQADRIGVDSLWVPESITGGCHDRSGGTGRRHRTLHFGDGRAECLHPPSDSGVDDGRDAGRDLGNEMERIVRHSATIVNFPRQVINI